MQVMAEVSGKVAAAIVVSMDYFHMVRLRVAAGQGMTMVVLVVVLMVVLD